MIRIMFGMRRYRTVLPALALLAALGLAGCGGNAGSTASSASAGDTASASSASAVSTSTSAPTTVSAAPTTTVSAAPSTTVSAAPTSSVPSASATSSAPVLSTASADTGATNSSAASAPAGSVVTITSMSAASTAVTSAGGSALTQVSSASASASASIGAQGSAVSSPFFSFSMPGGWTFDGLSTGGQGGGLTVAQWTSPDKKSHLALTASSTSYAEQQTMLRSRGHWTSGPSAIQVGPLHGQVATLLSNQPNTTSVARAIFDSGSATAGVAGSLVVDLTTSAVGAERDTVLQQFQTALKTLAVP